MKNFKTNYLIVATFFSMLIMAITDSTKGILIPTFKEQFGVSDTIIGTFLVIGSLSYILATYFGSVLCKKYGQKRIMLIGMIIAGVTFFLTSFSQSFLHITIGYFILTIGISLITIGMNTIIPMLKVAYLGLLMNLLHFFFGVGATITQRVTGYLLYNGFDWRKLFVAYFGLYIISFVVYLFVTEPEREVTTDDIHANTAVNKYLITLFCLAVGFYISAEIQTANWLLNYLKEAYKFNSNNGSFYVALFFGIFSVGRLFGGFVIEKVGYLKSVLLSLSAALVLYTLGLVLGQNWVILISISGLFFAIGFPTLIIIVHKTFAGNGTHTVGIVSTTGSIVSMIVGYIIGVLNDSIGVVFTMYLIPISLLISIIMILLIMKETKRLKIN